MKAKLIFVKLFQGGVEAETRQALTNMGAILEAVGASHLNVVKVSTLH
jgi:enamine deaminase RidA (YjgF/YER057c/UK114 family)